MQFIVSIRHDVHHHEIRDDYDDDDDLRQLEHTPFLCNEQACECGMVCDVRFPLVVDEFPALSLKEYVCFNSLFKNKIYPNKHYGNISKRWNIFKEDYN